MAGRNGERAAFAFDSGSDSRPTENLKPCGSPERMLVRDNFVVLPEFGDRAHVVRILADRRQCPFIRRSRPGHDHRNTHLSHEGVAAGHPACRRHAICASIDIMQHRIAVWDANRFVQIRLNCENVPGESRRNLLPPVNPNTNSVAGPWRETIPLPSCLTGGQFTGTENEADIQDTFHPLRLCPDVRGFRRSFGAGSAGRSCQTHHAGSDGYGPA